MELLLRVNGIEPAFGIELGNPAPRHAAGRSGDVYRQANVSYSLLQRDDGRIVHHTLIDVGMGVVPSLLELEQTHGVHVVDAVVLTHSHPDHFAQLDWLTVALARNGRDQQPRPVPLFASRPCWETGPGKVFPHLADRIDFVPVEAARPFALAGLTVTPFAVEHHASAPGALGFVLECGGRKAVISGDFHTVPDEDNEMFRGADVCFLDANTWNDLPHIGHGSVLGNLRLIDKWKPRRTYYVHYSGLEDRDAESAEIREPLAPPEFRRRLKQVAGGRDVQQAGHGMMLGDDVPWPG